MKDSAVMAQKLEALRRCIERIQSKQPITLERLVADVDLQDILVLNLTRSVQLCVDIALARLSALSVSAPQTMGESFDALASKQVIPIDLAVRLRKAVGFRNLAVHNYEAINWAIVHAIATQHLDDFREFAMAVLDDVA